MMQEQRTPSTESHPNQSTPKKSTDTDATKHTYTHSLTHKTHTKMPASTHLHRLLLVLPVLHVRLEELLVERLSELELERA